MISDKIKETAKETVTTLSKTYGIKSIIFTGDQEKNARQVAKKLKIDEYYAELLPVDKVNLLEKMENKKNKNSIIAFVGDGVNDSPAIARADIGISMGDIASDSIVEASKIVLMNGKIKNLLDAIHISKKTMMIVKQNIIFAIIIKILVLILTVIGVSNMYFAVFADVGTSILCILNSIRLLFIKEINIKNNM